MNEMQIFQNDRFGQVRTVVRDGDPWFVAADVCRALEVRNTPQALTRLEEDERDIILNDTPGGRQKMGIISESGLYSLVLSSRKHEARALHERRRLPAKDRYISSIGMWVKEMRPARFENLTMINDHQEGVHNDYFIREPKRCSFGRGGFRYDPHGQHFCHAARLSDLQA